MDGTSDQELSPAEDAFARFLEEREEAGTSFEDFCAAHPGLADDLRRIRAGFQWADGLLESDSDGAAAPSNAGPVRPTSPDERYEILGEEARGGMGVVLRVRDVELKRVLAMKVLRAAGADRRAVARFTEEAQVTSQLEHPSIVPIHDVGRLADGRVFYTMPLVRGRDLGEVFRLARAGAEGWSRTRALGSFLRVCEAVGAAHERGVVHRDLKPANVMVGAHGEVYVMDWGLARLLADSDVAGAAAPRPESSRREVLDQDPSSSIGTIDGQVLGTPSYMSPEQARGAVEEVGRASDVYSAGAMLYELLAGARPYVGRDETPDTRTVLQRVLAGPPPPVHGRATDVPTELVAICEKAMGREPSDRYPDMAALAEDLRAYLEHRVVTAYRTGALAELQKWVQRNRGLAAAIGVALLALVGGLVATAVLKGVADDEARRATANLGTALEAVDSLLTRVGSGDLVDVPGAQAIRAELLEDALGFYQGFLEDAGDDFEARLRVAHARGRLSDIYTELDRSEEATASQEATVADLRVLRDEAGEGSPEARRARRSLTFQLLELSTVHMRAFRHAEALAPLDEALSLSAELVAAHDDPELERFRAKMYRSKGYLLERTGDDDAEAWLLRSIETLEECQRSPRFADQLARVEDELATSFNHYAVFLLRAGRFEDARAPLEESIAWRESAVRASPESRALRSALHDALVNLTSLLAQLESGSREAEVHARRSLELAEGLAEDFPNMPIFRLDVGEAKSNLALVLSDRGEHERAVATMQSGIEDGRHALARAPDEEPVKRGLSGLYQNLFWVLFAAGRHAEIAERVAEVPAIDPDEAVPYWRVSATALAYCAENVLADESLPPEERERLADGHVAQMVDYFHEMAERGYVDPSYLEREWFDAVRGRPEVVALARELTERTEQAELR